MVKLSAPKPVKLFVGMISRDPSLFAECADRLAADYGPVDMRSDVLPWEHTDYYGGEMGPGLRRMFIFFGTLIDPEDLARIKLRTIELEEVFSLPGPAGNRRTINLDPGYLTEAKVVLATTKDFPHRIYIGANIYAEVTLHYSRDSRTFIPLEHTYPDFRTVYCRTLFTGAREKLRSGLRG